MTDRVIETREGGVLSLTLNRPDKRNAIDRWMLEDFIAALRRADEDRRVRAVLLCGAGRHFCAGLDREDERGGEDFARACGQLALRAVVSLGKPVVAAVQGTCAGLGAAIALACDVRVMAEDGSLDPAGSDALVAEGGMSWFLVRSLGYGRAFDVLTRRDHLSALRCLELGLISEAVPHARLMVTATETAHALSALPAQGVACLKAALREASSASLMEAVGADAHWRHQERGAVELLTSNLPGPLARPRRLAYAWHEEGVSA